MNRTRAYDAESAESERKDQKKSPSLKYEDTEKFSACGWMSRYHTPHAAFCNKDAEEPTAERIKTLDLDGKLPFFPN